MSSLCFAALILSTRLFVCCINGCVRFLQTTKHMSVPSPVRPPPASKVSTPRYDLHILCTLHCSTAGLILNRCMCRRPASPGGGGAGIGAAAGFDRAGSIKQTLAQGTAPPFAVAMCVVRILIACCWVGVCGCDARSASVCYCNGQ